MKLPDLVRQYTTENAVAALSGTLGEPIQRVRAATSAAIPSLLSFYASKVSNPAGSDAVYEALHDRGPAVIDQLPDSLAGSDAYKLIDEGTQQFTHLFGRDSLEGLSHAISQFSGLGLSSSRSVLGVLNSIVIAAISKHSSAESGHEVASFISANKQSISEMIPAGLHEYLDEVPNLRGVMHSYDDGVSATGTDDAMEDEASIVRQENVHNDRYYRVDHNDSDRIAALAWVIPLLIVVAIGTAVVYTLMPRETASPVASAPPPAVAPLDIADRAQPAGATIGPQANPLAELQPAGDTALGRDLGETIQLFTQSLKQMQGPANASAAQEQLRKTRDSLKQIGERYAKLPATEQRQVASRLSDQLPALQSAADQAGTKAAGIRPLVQEILQQLHSMAQHAT